MSTGPRIESLKRNWGSDDSQTPILHIDMDAFFVSVELLDAPQYRGFPVVVAGDDNHGVVSAASYEARKYGINSAMPIAIARRKCPNLINLPHRMWRYREVSQQVMQIFQDFSPYIEPLSVDEAFIDVSGAQKIFGTPFEIAVQIRRRVAEEVGLTCSIGVANTKHLAKIASTQAKPNGMLLIPAERSREFLALLPVSALWGVGKKTLEKLTRAGIFKVSDIVELGPERITKLLGASLGKSLYALALNQDERKVESYREEKSISRERTFYESVKELAAAQEIVLELSRDVARRLRKSQLLAKTFAVKLRSTSFDTWTRSFTFPTPTDKSSVIFRKLSQVFLEQGIPEGGFRLIGVRAENLSQKRGDFQMQLELADFTEEEKVAGVLDSIMDRFGDQVIGFTQSSTS